MASLIVVASSRAIIAGRMMAATITICPSTGKIASVIEGRVVPASEFPAGTVYMDYSPLVLLPGLVDAHVHLNEPGRTEWEGFYTGTQAAAFGGVTTVVDMPLNAIPPTTTVAALHEKIRAARGKCWVDVGFYGGLVPGNRSELKPLVREGVRGFKGFLIDSGVSNNPFPRKKRKRERGMADESQVKEFPAVTPEDVEAAMAELADEPTTLMFHAEMVPPATESAGDNLQTAPPSCVPAGPLQSYATFLESRPSSFETYAIKQIVEVAAKLSPRLPLHIVHLSAMEAIPLLRDARAKGIPITAETCFHYLSLAAEDIAAGDTRHKCCPPIRSQSNQDALWEELHRHAAADGVIKTVVSDHSPCTPDLKLLPPQIESNPASRSPSSSAAVTPSLESSTSSVNDFFSKTKNADSQNVGNFFAAWGGISSVGLGLPILWTELCRRREAVNMGSGGGPRRTADQALQDIAHWCCINTAKQVGLSHRKGDIAVGMDADFCVFDDATEWIVERSTLLFRNKCSPYEGKTLRGMVMETWVRGKRVFSKIDGFDNKQGPVGELILEPRTI